MLPSRQRDLLPLPTGASLHALLRGHQQTGGSIGQRKRAKRDRHRESWLEEGIEALNTMGGEGRAWNAFAPPSAAQVDAVQQLVRDFADLPGDTEHLDNLAAWKVLLGERPGYSDKVS
eukprot:4514552-Prorocentrum_lima.AAC.1